MKLHRKLVCILLPVLLFSACSPGGNSSSGGEESSWAVRLRLSFHPIVMLAAALRFAFCLLRLLLAQKKKEQPEEQKKQTA